MALTEGPRSFGRPPARGTPPGTLDSEMARAAGLEVSEVRLFETAQGGRYFGIQRFDREGRRRMHVHSFANLIHADYRIPSCDYADLLRLCDRCGRRVFYQ